MFLRSIRLRDWKAFTNTTVEFPAPRKPRTSASSARRTVSGRRACSRRSSWACTAGMRWACSLGPSRTPMATRIAPMTSSFSVGLHAAGSRPGPELDHDRGGPRGR